MADPPESDPISTRPHFHAISTARLLRAGGKALNRVRPHFRQAAELRTTPSTLRRRLEKEGSSYQIIKDELRRDFAIDFLCNSRLSVEGVAHALGFAEHSAFYRAFRKWTGRAPASTAAVH